MRFKLLIYILVCWTVSVIAAGANAGNLVLGSAGKSDYQIIVPDTHASPEIGGCLEQVARLLQTAFKANGIDLPVVAEGKMNPAKPGIYLGNTAFSRSKGVDVSSLTGWGYVHKVTGGRDLIIAGRDHMPPPPLESEKESLKKTPWARLGTAKGVSDFLRQYAGVRFLYPDLRHGESVKESASVNMLESPAIEFLKTPEIAVPSDLDVRKTPALLYNTGYPPRGSFYDIALNRFPLVDTVFGCHTYGRAIPVAKYGKTHPEYFALIGGKRLQGDDQYCISNPDVQELLYQDLIGWLERGYETVDLGQPDGFKACQCESCKKLFNTGDDWSEKLWILHRNLAERVLKAYPTKTVTMMSYILTANPPKTFKAFPKNTRIMLCGTNEEDIQPWLGYDVPKGFTSYVYNWCPNMGSRYTPMRTPRFVEAQAKRLFKYRVQGIYRDGTGSLFGLEGPVYYVMGRMFDDPENNAAKDLVQEFYVAAFGKASASMSSFYDRLYHGIELYSQFLGTRCPAWSYQTIEGGRPRKSLQDPFQLLGFLYTPSLISALDKDLTQAEKLADTDKVKTRLSLIRREFDYVRSLAKVVHLYQAYELETNKEFRDKLLEAIDARNALIAGYYDAKGNPTMPGWNYVLFPPSSHTVEHLRLAFDSYQSPFKNTCLNWDTKLMRQAQLSGAKSLAVKPAKGPVSIDSASWKLSVSEPMGSLPAGTITTAKTILQTLYDRDNFYVRVECQSPGPLKSAPQVGRDGDLGKLESLDIYLAPKPGQDFHYRFKVGLDAESKYDAASGFITDVMDPRYGKDDPVWNGDWKVEIRIDTSNRQWLALFVIPFKTLGVEPPSEGTVWRGNFGRIHLTTNNRIDRLIWSSAANTESMDDRTAFGELLFEKVPGSTPAAKPNEGSPEKK